MDAQIRKLAAALAKRRLPAPIKNARTGWMSTGGRFTRANVTEGNMEWGAYDRQYGVRGSR